MERRHFIQGTFAGALCAGSGLLPSAAASVDAADGRDTVVVVDAEVAASVWFAATAANLGARPLRCDDNFLITYASAAMGRNGTAAQRLMALLPSVKAYQLAMLAKDAFMYPALWETHEGNAGGNWSKRLAKRYLASGVGDGPPTPSAQSNFSDGGTPRLESLLLLPMIGGQAIESA